MQSPGPHMPTSLTSDGHCHQQTEERFGACKYKYTDPLYAERRNSSAMNADLHSCQQKTLIESRTANAKRTSRDDVSSNQYWYLSIGGELSAHSPSGHCGVGGSPRNPADPGTKCLPCKNIDRETCLQESMINRSNDKSSVWPSPDLRLESQQLLQQVSRRGFTPPRVVTSCATSDQSALTTRIDERYNVNEYG